MKRYKLKKTKWRVQTIGKLLIGVAILLIVISFVAPYVHIFLDKTSKVKWFGFRNLRTFLYAFGLPLSLFTSSILTLIACTYINEKIPKNILTSFGFVFNYSAIFHFVWIFWIRTPDFPKPYYYISIAIISLLATVLCVWFYKNRVENSNKIKNKIKTLFTFIYSLNTTNYIKEDKEEEFAISRIEVTDYVILEKDE